VRIRALGGTPPGARQFLRAALARLLNGRTAETFIGQRCGLRRDTGQTFSKSAVTELRIPNTKREIAIGEKQFYFWVNRYEPHA
jgi:hypothetical protein